MTLPWVAVMLLTYPWPEERRKYAEITLSSALKNIRYSGPMLVHIASDAASREVPEHYERLGAIVADKSFKAGISYADHGGYGASYNLATHEVHDQAEYILPLEDDWELNRQLDLDPLVRALQEGLFGCIRMGYIGFTQELRGRFVEAASQKFLLLDPDSPEPHVFSGHPRLETRDWERRVGLWPEGENPGATEFAVTHRREAREGVVWPIDLIRGYGDLFGHIGTIQARADQLEGVTA